MVKELPKMVFYRTLIFVRLAKQWLFGEFNVLKNVYIWHLITNISLLVKVCYVE
jgi:hypothetical protein